MSFLIDTNVAIHVRDNDPAVAGRVTALRVPPALSIMSLVELEGGIVKNPDLSQTRRSSLDTMLVGMEVIDFDRAVVSAYGEIIAAIGHSRPRIIDRLIAATAIVHDLTLITINGDDFRDIPDLSLEVWPSPPQ